MNGIEVVKAAVGHRLTEGKITSHFSESGSATGPISVLLEFSGLDQFFVRGSGADGIEAKKGDPTHVDMDEFGRLDIDADLSGAVFGRATGLTLTDALALVRMESAEANPESVVQASGLLLKFENGVQVAVVHMWDEFSVTTEIPSGRRLAIKPLE